MTFWIIRVELGEILNNPSSALLQLERFVNKGSPSGFHTLEGVSWQTHPENESDHYKLPLVKFRESDVEFSYHGSLPDALMDNNGALYACHPDMMANLQSCGTQYDVVRHLDVSPTASVRTVVCVQTGFHLKLSMDTKIGRFNRRISFPKWLASFENNSELVERVQAGQAPTEFAMLCEISGLHVKDRRATNLDDGFIVRDPKPYPSSSRMSMVPFFSLFSPDVREPTEPTLLSQMLLGRSDPLQSTMEMIIEPILKCYKFQAIDLGMIPENNAQNILLEIDRNANSTRIVHRDMMGTFKDLALRQQLGLRLDFEDYHSTDLSDGMSDTYKRRSFAYDFKLGEYVFSEIEQALSVEFNISQTTFRNSVKERFRSIVSSEPETYFGIENVWWSYEKVIPSPSNERPYKKNRFPKYR